MSTQTESQKNLLGHVAQVYANDASVRFSVSEFEIRTMVVDANGIIQAALDLRCSPVFAKALHEVLGKKINEFESSFGAIKT